MAKTRLSISLEADQADRIREHADRAGMDVSAYMTNAAAKQMAETDAIEAQFAKIDAEIAHVEAEAAKLPPVPEATYADLTEEERHKVDEVLDLMFGQDRSRDSDSGQAA